MEIYLFMKN